LLSLVRIADEDQLDDLLSTPTLAVIETLGRVKGDMILLGVAGKMGASLARMARRASDAAGEPRRVIGVSRFSSGGEEKLSAYGIETIRRDLLDEDAVAALPDAPLVIFMTGTKFGTRGHESTTWAMNSYLPGVICRKYRRSRIVAFSTGNVYGLVPVQSGGAREDDPLHPVGEYAASCVGRERILAHFSRTLGIPMSILRLNYACDLRYGVLVDLALQVRDERPIDLSMGYFNTIWQGDANAMTLRAFDTLISPPFIANITGPETLSVREVCESLGRFFGKEVRFEGNESASALLSNAALGLSRLGQPTVSAMELLDRVADWVADGGRTLGKPTHFESRDGNF
jgi:nucleoside-diphosphate-sugar epimerase